MDNQFVEPEIYFEVFQRSVNGQAILEELSSLFYDSDVYTKGDPYDTAYLAGKREVIRFILHKCSQAKQQ